MLPTNFEHLKTTLECGPLPNTMPPCRIQVVPSVQCRRVWLKSTTRVQCSNADKIEERKTWTQSECCTWQNSVTGQEPPKMYIWCTSPFSGGSCTLTEFWQLQNSLCVEVFRSPILPVLLHSTRAMGVSQSLWHGTRNGITDPSQRVLPIFGRAAMTLGIGPHSGTF